MALDSVSVGTDEDAGTVTLTCANHDGKDTIEIEHVHDLLERYDFRVSSTVADFSAGEVRLVVESDGGGA